MCVWEGSVFSDRQLPGFSSRRSAWWSTPKPTTSVWWSESVVECLAQNPELGLGMFFFGGNMGESKFGAIFLMFSIVIPCSCWCCCILLHRNESHFQKGDRDTLEFWGIFRQRHIVWLVVWNIFFPYIGNNYPNWLSYFSEVWLNHQPVVVRFCILGWSLFLGLAGGGPSGGDLLIILVCLWSFVNHIYLVMIWSFPSIFPWLSTSKI